MVDFSVYNSMDILKTTLTANQINHATFNDNNPIHNKDLLHLFNDSDRTSEIATGMQMTGIIEYAFRNFCDRMSFDFPIKSINSKFQKEVPPNTQISVRLNDIIEKEDDVIANLSLFSKGHSCLDLKISQKQKQKKLINNLESKNLFLNNYGLTKFFLSIGVVKDYIPNSFVASYVSQFLIDYSLETKLVDTLYDKQIKYSSHNFNFFNMPDTLSQELTLVLDSHREKLGVHIYKVASYIADKPIFDAILKCVIV